MISQKRIKPWGYELLLEKNKKYVLKKLFMKNQKEKIKLFLPAN